MQPLNMCNMNSTSCTFSASVSKALSLKNHIFVDVHSRGAGSLKLMATQQILAEQRVFKSSVSHLGLILDTAVQIVFPYFHTQY